ncbi:hypothetical protein XELAEV_18029228mg [Xenopus laevis]|uniref:Uncharacterized protein n=1 Tax=Xenopus laevis TaxID=8355 RepID=A0A974HHJ9_XENLA|nr:hypothetical protein XELAEV_18029228mg [Xenopus laevis]
MLTWGQGQTGHWEKTNGENRWPRPATIGHFRLCSLYLTAAPPTQIAKSRKQKVRAGGLGGWSGAAAGSGAPEQWCVGPNVAVRWAQTPSV